MINVVVYCVCWANGALHCMWPGFFSRSEAKMLLKGGHVVTDMTEKKSIVLRRFL